MENRGPACAALFIAFTAVALVFVGLRLGIRLHRHLFGWDDLFVTISMAASIAQSCVANVAIHYGYGKHIRDITHPDLLNTLFYFWVAQMLYKICTWSYKASILMMYYRVFGDTPNIRAYGVRFKSLLYAILGVVAGTFVASFVISIFACVPVPRNWDKSVHGHCVDTAAWWYSYATLNISTDIIILAMPLPLINGLMQVPQRQKVVLMGVFMIGGFVCGVTIIRTTTFLTAMQVKDPTYNGIKTFMWTAVESNVGIICACMPVLRPLLQQILPWFLEHTTRAGRSRRTGYDSYQDDTETERRRQGKQERNDSEPNQWNTSDNVILSHISSRRPQSRHSDEVGFAHVIVRKTDIETSVEPAGASDSELVRDDLQPAAVTRNHIV